jgi:hypothetical protein
VAHFRPNGARNNPLRLTRLDRSYRIIRVDTNGFESFQASQLARHTGRLKPRPSDSNSIAYQTVIDDLDRLVR